MSAKKKALLLGCCLILTLAISLTSLALQAQAQISSGYDLSWWTMDGGGGSAQSANGYSLSSTIGQPDAKSGMTAGSYTLSGGFWAGGGNSGYKMHLPLIMRQ